MQKILLYHYVPKDAFFAEKGILSVSLQTEALSKYAKRAKTQNPKEIIDWLEGTFNGRSKAIPVLTEPVKWQGNDPMPKEWIKRKILLTIDYNKLLTDDLIEAVYCKEMSEENGFNEKIYRILPNQIDFSPLSWNKCSYEKGLFFGAIRHYFLVMKNGYIPYEYIQAQN